MERISEAFDQKKNLGRQKEPLTVGDVALSHKHLTFSPDEHVKVILPLMLSSECGAVGVLDENECLVGLLTEREILKRIFYTASDHSIHPHNVGKYIDDMTVRDAMIPAPETLGEQLDIEDGLNIMLQHGYRHMPVVRKYDKTALVGIISDYELTLHLKYKGGAIRKTGKAGKAAFSHLMHKPYGSGTYSPFA